MITEQNRKYAVVVQYNAREIHIEWCDTPREALDYYQGVYDSDKWILKHLPISVDDGGE